MALLKVKSQLREVVETAANDLDAILACEELRFDSETGQQIQSIADALWAIAPSVTGNRKKYL